MTAGRAEAVPPVVELDLSGLTFLDSVGIRSLLDCRRLVLDAGSRLVLADPPRLVTRILDITGLLDYFPMSVT